MGQYVASQVIKTMIKKNIAVNNAKILMLGITFKENCPDVRNTKIVDVIAALEEYGTHVTLYDPWANPEEVKREYSLTCHPELLEGSQYDAVVLGVAHKDFLNLALNLYLKENSVVYDVKGILKENVDSRL